MVKRRRSSSNNPFGFGSGSGGLGDFGLGDGLRKYQKRVTLSNNRMKGKMAEDSFQLEQNLQGNDCRKIHKGGDFIVQKRDIFGNKVGKPTVHEVKTGNAKLSYAQKRKKARLGNSRYKVERYY
ncbi:MAG: hypothetical protein ACM3UL_02525 [Ignavibacteria bacterium]